MDSRWCPRGSLDENVRECNASSKPCSNSFQDGFLRGKPARKVLNSAGALACFVEFLSSEAARDQQIVRILYPPLHFSNFDQINPMSYNVHIRCSPPLRFSTGHGRWQFAQKLLSVPWLLGRSKTHNGYPKRREYTMNDTNGMFWSGETLSDRLPRLIEPFASDRVDCAAYRLAVGPEVYVSPNDQTSDPTTVTVRKLGPGDAFTIPPGQFAFLLTEEIVTVPASALAFISIRAKTKFRGLVNVSGFHVDPGYRGQLTFAVFNAGPIPIHLKRGQQIFLIWYASLDRETEIQERRQDQHGYRHLLNHRCCR